MRDGRVLLLPPLIHYGNEEHSHANNILFKSVSDKFSTRVWIDCLPFSVSRGQSRYNSKIKVLLLTLVSPVFYKEVVACCYLKSTIPHAYAMVPLYLKVYHT